MQLFLCQGVALGPAAHQRGEGFQIVWLIGAGRQFGALAHRILVNGRGQNLPGPFLAQFRNHFFVNGLNDVCFDLADMQDRQVVHDKYSPLKIAALLPA